MILHVLTLHVSWKFLIFNGTYKTDLTNYFGQSHLTYFLQQGTRKNMLLMNETSELCTEQIQSLLNMK